ncbi:MAG: hypothetical protein Q7T30_02785 [Planctomycetota bacterium]|nr:hypothetical protein [Planctomycetota bacterium]
MRRMDADSIRKLCRQVPFQPFTLRLADGRALDVPHPEFILVSSRGRQVIVDSREDMFEIVDVPLILSAEVRGSGVVF